MKEQVSFYKRFCQAYQKNFLASLALKFFIFLSLIGVYAPLFASSKPILVQWHGKWFSPLFRYLWFPGFYTKPIDLFFNVLMVTLPFFILSIKILRSLARRIVIIGLLLCQLLGFFFASLGGVQDPGKNQELAHLRSEHLLAKASPKHPESLILQPRELRTWELEKNHMSTYEQLNLLIKAQNREAQHKSLQKFSVAYETRKGSAIPSLRQLEMKNEAICLQRLEKQLQALTPHYLEALQAWGPLVDTYRPFMLKLGRIEHDLLFATQQTKTELLAFRDSLEKQSIDLREQILRTRSCMEEYHRFQGSIQFILDKREWITKESQDLRIWMRPLLSRFHWEDDAGGSREVNKYVHWWQLTRTNRKDLFAALIFGIRIALVVGGIGVAIALVIGTLIGLFSGYFGGTCDIILSRFTEIWETMPMLFILMLVVAITQQKSLFLNTILLGCFGWTGFSRYIRLETMKQKNMGYVLASRNLCYSHYHIMLHQILPNAIVPVLSLLPFSVMAMISCEAGLTFLGLGEESSASWGNLMREGVAAFPAESAVLWPPAIMLTAFLIAIALIGDGIRDALDPRSLD